MAGDGVSNLANGLISQRRPLDALSRAECAQWENLLTYHSDLENAFVTPGFARAVAASGLRVEVLTLQAQGPAVEESGAQGQSLLAVLPFQFRTRVDHAVGLAEKVGAHMSDAAGPILHPSIATRLTGPDLIAKAGLGAFRFDHLPESLYPGAFGSDGNRGPSLGVEAPRGTDLTPQVAGHLMPIGTDAEAYLATTKDVSKDFARKMRRYFKRLSALGPLRFTWQTEDPERELDRIIAHKRARYRQTGTPDALAPAWCRRLLHQLVAQKDPLCEPVISTLHGGEHWLASHIGLKCGATMSYWFPVYNPDFASDNPGHVFLWHFIQACPAQGVTRIDQGEGEQSHKRKFKTVERRYHGGLWYQPRLRGLPARALLSLRWRTQGLRQPPQRPLPASTG